MSPAAKAKPSRAMVLAAGLGKRMRPLTTTTPKPLIEVAGKPLLDHMLDRLVDAGVEEVVVNVHYLPALIESHLGRRRAKSPRILISDERERLLETGGGVKKALRHLGGAPFLVVNTDDVWADGPRPNLTRLIEYWDMSRMDALLLLAPTATSFGYEGRGDFAMDPFGRLRRRRDREVCPFVFAGVSILNPSLFSDTPEGAFSLNLIFDKAAAQGRLFGLRLDGFWMHVGTPSAVAGADARLAESVS
ncbi:MAG: nucleotidyltransferase family protein [Hyphomicrobiales bacterium]|nr:nucleotidyltransferase family protein [Hyphomicrobiales bacterium]MBV9052356.1 nucleotidyltransferase family protein [Hyphomicrobiales bacterium]MBV9974529.1 nucleotidyltransferase family protein [Hyphomicrobiales bacterium]